MAKKALCLNCGKGTIGLFDGMLLSVKRKEFGFTVAGKDARVHINCPFCKAPNFVAIETNTSGELELKASGSIEEHTYKQEKEEENKNNEEEKKDEQEKNESEESGDDKPRDGDDKREGAKPDFIEF